MAEKKDDLGKLMETLEDLRPTLELFKEMQDSGLTETLEYLVANFDRIFNYTTKMEFYDLLTAMKKISLILKPISTMSDDEVESIARILRPLPSAIRDAKERSESAKPIKTVELIKLIRSEDIAFLIFLAMAISNEMRK